MANKEKKISVNAFEKAAEETLKDIYTTLEWRGLQIRVKKRLGLHEAAVFVDAVSGACFDGETGEYIPAAEHAAFGVALLRMYTNISLPASAEKQYEFVAGTDIVDEVMDRIDMAQWSYLRDAVHAKINYVLHMNVSLIEKQVSDTARVLDSIRDRFNDLLGGVDGDTMSKVLNTISEHGFDEDKLARAVINEKFGDNESGEAGADGDR